MKQKEMKKTTRDWLSGKMIGSLLTALFLLLGAPSFAQEVETVSVTVEDEFNEWDVDDDDLWTEDEFGTAFDEGGLYDEWDLNDDNYLDYEELSAAFITVYDINQDKVWTKGEFDSWANARGKNYEFHIWDTNDDELLDQREFGEAVREAGIYEDWDADTNDLYSIDEVRTILFDTWDLDDNDYLDLDEYETYGYGLW